MTFNLRLKDDIAIFTKQLFYTLFDEAEKQEKELRALQIIFLKVVSEVSKEDGNALWNAFLKQLPEIKKNIQLDAKATEKNDPACKSLEEIYLAYPGFHAIAIYRLSHELFKLNLPVVSRMMSEYIHGITGIDIHPGATIGKSFFIDHGTGIVIQPSKIMSPFMPMQQFWAVILLLEPIVLLEPTFGSRNQFQKILWSPINQKLKSVLVKYDQRTIYNRSYRQYTIS